MNGARSATRSLRRSCRHGWSERRQSFVQSYDGDALDASLLLLPLVGFLPPDDPRVIKTVEAIQRELDGGRPSAPLQAH